MGRMRALVDDVVEWSYVPEVFLAGVQRAVSGSGTSLVGMPAFRASLERDMVAATEQLFGLMLSSEVVLVEPGSGGFQPWPGRGVHATIDLLADEHVFTLVFRTTDDSARVITAQLVGATPDDVHETDQLATAAEFANIIAGRVRNRLVESGLDTTLRLPRTWVGDTAEGFEARDASDLTFLSVKPQAHFELLLGVRPLPPADAGGPPLVTVPARAGLSAGGQAPTEACGLQPARSVTTIGSAKLPGG
jgi:CheY-specific phosphatase CheX